MKKKVFLIFHFIVIISILLSLVILSSIIFMKTAENKFIVPLDDYYIYTIKDISEYNPVVLDVIEKNKLALIIKTDEKIIEIKIKANIFRPTAIMICLIQTLIIYFSFFIFSKVYKQRHGDD